MSTVHFGANVTEESETALFELGTRYMAEDGKEYIYLLADEAITGAGYAVLIDHDYGSQMVDATSTTAARGKGVGLPRIAVTSGYYYWAQIYGASTVRVAASYAAGAALYCTATGGVLDDAATSGLEVIDGLYGAETDGGSGSAIACIANYPVVGATA